MKYEYRSVKIFYKYVNRKSEAVNVFLHGWGCDHTSLEFCEKLTDESCLFVDFPPFGKSGKDLPDWNVFTYANMVISLLKQLGIQKYSIVGHSFGGRIAIILAVLCKENVRSLVLVDSAGVKPRRSIKYYAKVGTYKIKKMMGLDVSKYGSADYLALDENMRKVFSSIVSTHLDEFLPYITCKTFIIFGKDDKTTKVYMAKRLHRKIKDSQLVILEEAGHFPFVDRRLEFSAILKDCLQKR